MKKGLGKGLEALFSIYDEENEKEEKQVSKKVDIRKDSDGVLEIAIEEIRPNPNQPRKNFDQTALEELAQSIKNHGVIQPLVVNKEDDGYMIIAGERRYRAAKLAGLEFVPCIVKNYTEKQIKEIALIENLQREDLNPVEAAKAIKQLMDEYNFTQEIVADRIGKSRPNVTNLLRLLSLYPDVLKLVESGRLSAGHARCLVVVSDYTQQLKFANMASDNKMSVRDLEKAVKNYLNPKKLSNQKAEQSVELKELVNEMQRVFSTKVSVIGNDKKGRIYIDYYSRDDLDRISELIELAKTKTLTLKNLKDINKRQ